MLLFASGLNLNDNIVAKLLAKRQQTQTVQTGHRTNVTVKAIPWKLGKGEHKIPVQTWYIYHKYHKNNDQE